jgi:uncharacterized membrane protein
MDGAQKILANPRTRAVVALLPLTIALIVVMAGSGDKSGPHHGNIRLALEWVAMVGVQMLWFVALRTPKSS